MSSEFGKALKVQIFGESHGKAIGCVIDGFPAGETIDSDALYTFMARRRPGGNSLGTARNEADRPVFLSGVRNGVTDGFPICAIIENSDTKSGDYTGFLRTPRPSHADYTALLRYGESVDMRGSGHFSGRLTAPLCIAGGIAKELLSRRGIYVGAHLKSVGCAEDVNFPLHPTKELFESVAAKPLAVIDEGAADEMRAEIESARAEGDSVGGSIECAIIGLPGGVGSPMFDGVENRLAAVLFGIPAVKGVEFGAGFNASRMRGSEHNDPYIFSGGRVAAEKNDAGGIVGGITNGMPIVFRAAIKPTPSIAKAQRTVDLEAMTDAEIEIKGRHDPCIAVRAVPVIEAAAAIAILDLLLEEKKWN